MTFSAQLVLEAPKGVNPKEFQDQVDATIEAIEVFKEISTEAPSSLSPFSNDFFKGYLAAADVEYNEELVSLLRTIVL